MNFSLLISSLLIVFELISLLPTGSLAADGAGVDSGLPPSPVSQTSSTITSSATSNTKSNKRPKVRRTIRLHGESPIGETIPETSGDVKMENVGSTNNIEVSPDISVMQPQAQEVPRREEPSVRSSSIPDPPSSVVADNFQDQASSAIVDSDSVDQNVLENSGNRKNTVLRNSGNEENISIEGVNNKRNVKIANSGNEELLEQESKPREAKKSKRVKKHKCKHHGRRDHGFRLQQPQQPVFQININTNKDQQGSWMSQLPLSPLSALALGGRAPAWPFNRWFGRNSTEPEVTIKELNREVIPELSSLPISSQLLLQGNPVPIPMQMPVPMVMSMPMPIVQSVPLTMMTPNGPVIVQSPIMPLSPAEPIKPTKKKPKRKPKKDSPKEEPKEVEKPKEEDKKEEKPKTLELERPSFPAELHEQAQPFVRTAVDGTQQVLRMVAIPDELQKRRVRLPVQVPIPAPIKPKPKPDPEEEIEWETIRVPKRKRANRFSEPSE